MSEPRPKRQRVTPRNSNANELATQAQTPYANLRQLASLIKKPAATPYRRAVSAGPETTPGTERSANTTPGTQNKTPRSVGRTGLYARPVIARRGPPTTPHAIRALQQRRNAAITPGKNRRRSGRMQRETPRDTLRALSRLLAPKSKPIVATPRTGGQSRRNSLLDDIDDESDPRPPRLSMPLDFESDDEDAPPRLSALPEDLDNDNLTANLTAVSLETGRRAISEDPRYTRRSLGRLSERFPGINDLSFDAGDGADPDATFLRENNLFGDNGDINIDDGTINLGDEATADLRALMETTRQRSRYSDLGIPGLDDHDEPTFQFRIGGQDRLAQPVFTYPPNEEDHASAANLVEGDEAAADYDDETALVGLEEPQSDASDGEEPILRQDSVELAQAPETDAKKVRRCRKEVKVSRYGIEYPSLPSNVVKRVATSFARIHGNSNTKLNKETLAAIVEASDWFFEQVGEDLGTYAVHAGRKTIEDSDVMTLMKRQRQLNATNTPFFLAQRYLPRELLQEMRMPAPKVKSKAHKRKRRLETVDEEDDEE
ncbi:hypothetical protein EJ05DRAFT_476728 [Pseudovirgaria hyperparasitica]|uniref:CENP-T/Histone H4 histone fold domain-containing protein n=1 Tax=Pseudovirgaria hyperparasitica TaxID=470096 RepID=A0A6A6W3F7_9PEZI|nr:uncharacterized protein EJ05DRAFT_476728 [Pseudovirgaria hyperparasitica]KAF2757478.1 hypothetical protein EJ05DRAFT_476728 [Pseudovirgaria hyperparasitica]